MRTSRTMLVFAVAAALGAAACGKKPKAEEPAPQPQATDDEARRRAEQEAAERAAREAEEARRREEAARVRSVLEEVAYFDYDRSEIRGDTRSTLDRKVRALQDNPSIRLRIEGHADERGSVEYNLALGMRRANAVKDYLSLYGVDAGRLETVSFGEERPADPGSDEEAWARNRRAEFRIIGGPMARRP